MVFASITFCQLFKQHHIEQQIKIIIQSILFDNIVIVFFCNFPIIDPFTGLDSNYGVNTRWYQIIYYLWCIRRSNVACNLHYCMLKKDPLMIYTYTCVPDMASWKHSQSHYLICFMKVNASLSLDLPIIIDIDYISIDGINTFAVSR